MSSLHSTSEIDDSTYAASDDVIHNGEAWASVPTADPWDPAILTVDGGGIRGYASLLILQRLMREVAKWERKLDAEQETALSQSWSQSHSRQGSAYERRRKTSPSPSPLRQLDTNRSARPASIASVGDPPSGSATPPMRPDLHLAIPGSRASSVRDGITSIAEDAPSSSDHPDNFEDTLLPCHYFDYMYGTSTGGLIVTMLGRLRMTVPQCLAIYREVGERLFGRRRSILPLATKYFHRPLEDAVKDIVRNNCPEHAETGGCTGEDWYPWGTNGEDPDGRYRQLCQSVCLSAVHNGSIDEAHLLRSYNHQYESIPEWITPYNPGADKLKIWQVTRATSAAPFFFDMLEAEVKGETWAFKDGGIRENNPAGAAWSEFVSLYGEQRDPALLLSIGTGRPDESQDGFASSWPGPFGNSFVMKKTAEKFAVIKNVLIKYTAGEEKHKDMVFTARGEHTWYKRLNIDSGLENMKLDEWKSGPWTNPWTDTTSTIPGGATLTAMEQAAAEYLSRDKKTQALDGYAAPKTKLDQMAEKLVRQRRARMAARDTAKWDAYMGKSLGFRQVGKGVMPVANNTNPNNASNTDSPS